MGWKTVPVVGKKTQRGPSSSSSAGVVGGQKKQKQEDHPLPSTSQVTADSTMHTSTTDAPTPDGRIGQPQVPTASVSPAEKADQRALQPVTDSLRHWRKRLSKDLRPLIESLVDCVERGLPGKGKDAPGQPVTSNAEEHQTQTDTTPTTDSGASPDQVVDLRVKRRSVILLAGLGIGSFVQSSTAVKQLAFLLSLLDAINARLVARGAGQSGKGEGKEAVHSCSRVAVRTIIFDPVMSQEDVAICQLFGLEIDSVNRRGDLSTWLTPRDGQDQEKLAFCLCYMPRCPWALYNNVLASLWNTNPSASTSKQVESGPQPYFGGNGERFLLLGNDLRRFDPALNQSGQTRSNSAIIALRPLLVFHHARTFHSSTRGTSDGASSDELKKKSKSDRRQGGDAEALFTEIGELTVIWPKPVLGSAEVANLPTGPFEYLGTEGDLR